MKTFSKFIEVGSLTLFICAYSSAQIGLWTSSVELAGKPMTGTAWNAVKEAADAANPSKAVVSDQDSHNNVQILAAGIVYARTGIESYKDKVVAACEKLVSDGYPVKVTDKENRTLAWARETGAYVLAADLVEYRTVAFESWLRDMAENYVAEDNRTLLYMFKKRPNNWGSHAFGSLCAIYAYLLDSTRLNEVRDYWIQAIGGPKPDDLDYGDDLSWHVDQTNLRLINPKGAVKEELNIDGIAPDDMRRNGSFSNPPPYPSTSYHWGVLQGMVMAGRILERSGLSIWNIGDNAIYRAYTALQIRWNNEFGEYWKAEGDDLWMLPFLDNVYGTNCSEGQPERMWEYGKNTGWPYVVLKEGMGIGSIRDINTPEAPRLCQNYPNPFNPKTNIRYDLNRLEHVKLSVFDITGRTLATLVTGLQNPGKYSYMWEAVNSEGSELPSGIYFCRIQTSSFIETFKMILIR